LLLMLELLQELEQLQVVSLLVLEQLQVVSLLVLEQPQGLESEQKQRQKLNLKPSLIIIYSFTSPIGGNFTT